MIQIILPPTFQAPSAHQIKKERFYKLLRYPRSLVDESIMLSSMNEYYDSYG